MTPRPANAVFDAQAADLFLREYVRRLIEKGDLLPEGEVRVVLPLEEHRNVARVIEVDGAPHAIVQLYPRGDVAAIDHHFLADRLVQDHGLAAPRLLDVHEDAEKGCVAILKQYIAGSHPTPEAMAGPPTLALAEALARLHAVTSDRFGDLVATQGGPFEKALFERAMEDLLTLRRRAPSWISSADRRRVRKWFRQCAGRLEELRVFSLIHTGLDCDALIWQPDRRRFAFLSLIDLRYGHRAADLVRARHEVLGGDEDNWAAFEKRYFRGNDKAAVDECTRVQPFYEAWRHLSLCALYCLDESTEAEAPVAFGPHRQPQSVAHWRRLLELIEAEPSP